jgi:hypothetical protein
MGGSGGDFQGGDASGMAEMLRKAELEAEDQIFRSDVESLLSQVLAGANDRDPDAVAKHLETIRQALDKNIEGTVELLFGGSVAKRTYVQGISDVDVLVIINESELAASDPRTVCDYFLGRLSERLGTRVIRDGFAITVQFADMQVQVVPVIRRGTDFLLPSDDCASWSQVRPQVFSEALRTTNKACSGKVVPIVKLAKVLLSNLPEDRRPNGYHLENLAVEAFSGYEGPCTPRAMLQRFFDRAPDLIRTPIPDRTGQSIHVDDYLGVRDSVERLVVADSVARIGRRLLNADGAKDIEQWKQLLEVDP